MKNIDELLKEAGVEIPADKMDAFKQSFHSNYKTVAEFDKKVERINALEEDKKSLNETLKAFEGVKPEELNGKIAELTNALADRDAKYQKDLEARDKKDAIARELDKLNFTSQYSRKAVEEMLNGDEVIFKNGKLLGFAERIAEIKESNADAFVNEEQQKLEQNKVSFTQSINGTGGQTVTLDDYYKLSTSDERQKFIREHSELFARK